MKACARTSAVNGVVAQVARWLWLSTHLRRMRFASGMTLSACVSSSRLIYARAAAADRQRYDSRSGQITPVARSSDLALFHLLDLLPLFHELNKLSILAFRRHHFGAQLLFANTPLVRCARDAGSYDYERAVGAVRGGRRGAARRGTCSRPSSSGSG